MTATTKPEWVKSEDAGYSPGKLLLDSGRGHWSVYRHGSRWVAAYVEDMTARNHPAPTFRTRREAMAHAESRS